VLVLIIELLPTQSDSVLFSIVKFQTIVDVGVLDVAGTYGSAVLLFKLLVGYSKFSFYQGIVAPGSFGFDNGHSRWCRFGNNSIIKTTHKTTHSTSRGT